MRKILILSLLFALLAGVAEAQQTPWRYYFPIDEMTGKKDYSREKVWSGVRIENTQWDANLFLFCKDGGLAFFVGQYKTSELKPVELDGDRGLVALRLKFNNNEPFFTPWVVSEQNLGRVNLFPYPDLPEIEKIRKKIIKGMIKHRRMWIGFNIKSIPYIAKFDLTGFSRELAKCSRIPDTN